ncbi:MAG: phospholipase D-like domain-containing protein, partial [Myxococcota bacterium]|nr:phospholipase D-like domain-containing protein [Myxococcota bacterium]
MRPALPSLASLCLFTACAAPDLHTERLDLTDLPGVSETPEDVPVMAMWSTTPGSKTDSAVGTALVALLDAAGHSIDASAYEISDPAIVDALLRAWDRGVHVRLVSDADEADGAGFAAITEAGIPVALRPAGDRIMHDKFIVVDRQAVWTGSTNLTPTGLLRNDNDAVLIESPDLAAAYTAELDQMAVDGAFGTAKNDLAGPRDFEVDAAQ